MVEVGGRPARFDKDVSEREGDAKEMGFLGGGSRGRLLGSYHTWGLRFLNGRAVMPGTADLQRAGLGEGCEKGDNNEEEHLHCSSHLCSQQGQSLENNHPYNSRGPRSLSSCAPCHHTSLAPSLGRSA